MQRWNHPLSRYIAVLCFLCLSSFGAGQELMMSRWTVDGGGVMHSAGGEYEVSGTIGQADAGTLAGGPFELSGGFWFALTPADCNDDGTANLLDHQSFEQCLSGPAGGVPAGCACFDVDGSGTIDLRDFAVAQSHFHGL